MANIKESRRLSFGDKILKLADVVKIAEILNSEYRLIRSDKNRPTINFTVVCGDDTVYESQDVDIFEPQSVINSKKVSSVKLWFSDYGSRRTIRVEFEGCYSGSFYRNFASVEGYDSNWVNGILGRLSQAIKSIEPQNRHKSLYVTLIHVAAAFLIGRATIFFFLLLPFKKSQEADINPTWLAISDFLRNNELAHNATLYLASFILGFLPALTPRSYFAKLWPHFEIQIGPAHEFVESKRRQMYRNLVIFIIAPLLAAAIYDITKSLL